MRHNIVLVLIAALLLSGCVFPIQRTSPDPPVAPDLIEEPSDSEDFDRPVDSKAESPAASAPSIPAPAGDAAHSVPSDDPQIAVFWYAMADTRVEELR